MLAAGDIDVKGTSLPSDVKQHPMSKTQRYDHRHPENTTSKIRIVHAEEDRGITLIIRCKRRTKVEFK